MLAPVLKYGLLKERMAALITDGIRAVKRDEKKAVQCRDSLLSSMTKELNVETTLQKLLKK